MHLSSWTCALVASTALLLGASVHQVQACTVIAVGRNATIDGSTLLAHTDDAGSGASDLRLVRVPAADHPPNSLRPVYNFNGGYPRLVSLSRGPEYMPKDDDEPHYQKLMKPLGYIPQVAHTYAYWDQDYGMMNEKQLGMSESTCGAKTVGWPLDVPHGHNLFGIAELSKVALERCDSARCAIQTMGDLAVEYGFYSEDSGNPLKPDYGDSAEGLGITDRFGETWIFHIMTGANNASAIWVAQRIPEDHFTAIANGFTIRKVDFNDKDNFMWSSNIFDLAIEKGWWSKSMDSFDFTAVYGSHDKDAIGPLYIGRRIWRIFDVLAPSLKLDSRLGCFSQYETYPLSARPDKKIELNTIFELLRDHFEGTEYDMTKGIAAGPFGSPIRYDGPDWGVAGGWERPMAMYRTLFTFVLQARGFMPDSVGGVVWYSQGSPHGSVHVPFSCRQGQVPKSYLVGRESRFTFESAWWAFNFVNNWSNLRFNVINAEVRVKMSRTQAEAFAHRAELERRALVMQESDEIDEYMQHQSNAFASKVVNEWWDLAWELVSKYSDGYILLGEGEKQMANPGYPAWWLQASEFSKWPGDSFTPRDEVKSEIVAISSHDDYVVSVPHHHQSHTHGLQAGDIAASTMNAAAAVQTIKSSAASSSSTLLGMLQVLVWITMGAAVGAAGMVYAQRQRRVGYRMLL